MLQPNSADSGGSGGVRGGSGGRKVFDIPQCARNFKEETRPPLETDNATYRPFARIGEGAFGLTFLAAIDDTKRLQALDDTPLSPATAREQRQLWSLLKGRSVVVKEIKKPEGDGSNAESLQLHGRNMESMDIVHNISHISHCRHPFIAKLLDSRYALTTHDTPFEVYEFYAVGDAMNLLEHIAGSDLRHREATNLQSFVVFLSLQVAEAVSFLHDSGFIHFDLKIDNVFIDETGDAKLGDFGLARACGLRKSIENPYYYWGSDCPAKVFTSIRWVPPEQLEEGRAMVDHAVDWYSLGALMFHMTYCRLPFEEHRQKAFEAPAESDRQLKRRFLKIWKANPRPKVDDRPKVNQKLKNFLYNLLSYEPATRLGSGGCAEVFLRFHGLCKDLDIRWLDAAAPTDVDKIRRLVRKNEFDRPYRIRLLQR